MAGEGERALKARVECRAGTLRAVHTNITEQRRDPPVHFTGHLHNASLNVMWSSAV